MEAKACVCDTDRQTDRQTERERLCIIACVKVCEREKRKSDKSRIPEKVLLKLIMNSNAPHAATLSIHREHRTQERSNDSHAMRG